MLEVPGGIFRFNLPDKRFVDFLALGLRCQISEDVCFEWDFNDKVFHIDPSIALVALGGFALLHEVFIQVHFIYLSSHQLRLEELRVLFLVDHSVCKSKALVIMEGVQIFILAVVDSLFAALHYLDLAPDRIDNWSQNAYRDRTGQS